MMAGFDTHSHCPRCREKKGQDPCVEQPGSACSHCSSLTPDQLTQLSTPTYKMKKEKRELKSSTPAKNPPSDSTLSPNLVDPSLVTVMGVVDGQSTSGSPGLSEKSAEKKKKKEDEKVASSKPVKPDKSVKSSHRPSGESTDHKLEMMEQKWSDHFNRLEALLLAKTLDREPTCSAVKVTLTHAPPASAISSEPFLRPSDQPSSSSQPSHPTAASASPATDPVVTATISKAGSDSSQPAHRPGTSGVTDQPGKRSFAVAFGSTKKAPGPVIQTLRVSVRIDLQLICTRKRVNYLMIMTCPLLTPTNPSRRNSHIEKR